MLDDKDINKLKSVFATKEDFNNLVTKKDLEKTADKLREEIKSSISDSQDRMLVLLASKKDVEEIRGDLGDLKELVQGIIISNDSIAKSIGDLTLEYAAIKHQINRHEEWIKQIAEKVGLKLAAD